jgi:hypothetical protein
MTKYIPKVNDIVFVEGKGVTRHLVISVDANSKTVRVQRVSGPVTFQDANVPWVKLSELDESQNALRVVREATENQ